MPARSRRPPGEGRLIQLVYYFYVGASRLALALPESFAYWLAHALGSFWARTSKKKRALVTRNLQRVTGLPTDSPQLARVVDDAFRSYARYWLETFRLVREERDFFLQRVRTKNEASLDLMTDGKRPVMVVGHLGNWDAAGAWVAATGRTNVVTVAEVLKPKRMFDFFLAHRERLGMTIFPAERGVTRKLIEAIERGHVVPLLGDRDLKGNGPEVSLFGEKTTLPAGPASLALRTGVPICIAGVYSIRFDDGRYGWEIDFSEPIDLPPRDHPNFITEATQRVAEGLERAIARRPEEWHVFQPFWTADRRS